MAEPESREDRVQNLQRIMKEAAIAFPVWAGFAGRSAGVVRTWAAGLRMPTDDGLEALASGAEKAADSLRDTARQLRALKGGGVEAAAPTTGAAP